MNETNNLETKTSGFMNLLLYSTFKFQDNYVVVPQSDLVKGRADFVVKHNNEAAII